MKLFVPRETFPGETRIAMTPEAARKLVQLGAEVAVEADLGAGLGLPDDAYRAAGVAIADVRAAALAGADMVLRLRPPPEAEVRALRRGAVHVSYMEPFANAPLVRACAEAGVSAVCMELIPRTTLAQKMDALSSQANLAGYVAVMLAAGHLPKALPMMMTPAGTLTPARVFVIGAGVAGLQAIATARRLGARVEAFDTRPVVEEQVHSLGAKFVKIALGETGQTQDGYAKALTEEQLRLQREGMARHCAQADIVITTAQVFGRPAPRILTAAMVAGMKSGSVVVDMAVETGGNVEGSVAGQTVTVGGVLLVGQTNLPGRVPAHASQMYASNLVNFVEHFWNRKSKTFELRRDDEILAGCLVTHDGAVVHEAVRKMVEGAAG
jgi:NAD(P) transhydrogenase subunit alpha